MVGAEMAGAEMVDTEMAGAEASLFAFPRLYDILNMTKQQTWIYPRSSQLTKFIASGLVVFALILTMCFSVTLIILLKVAFRNIVPCSATGANGDPTVEKPLFSTTTKNSNLSNNTEMLKNSKSDLAEVSAIEIDYDDYSSIMTATGLCFAAITVLPAFLNGFLIMFMGYVAVKGHRS
uniref:Uncharacterized protein n=1 Tax=Romanomermis culicivorax TaxID=13658 RepID=A0A915IEF7_ROMCU